MAPSGSQCNGASRPPSAVEVEVSRRPLLEPKPIVLWGVLEELRCLLEHVLVERLALQMLLYVELAGALKLFAARARIVAR